MKSFEAFLDKNLKCIRCVFTDIDDTLRGNGYPTARTFTAMEDLKNSGVLVVSVTERRAG